MKIFVDKTKKCYNELNAYVALLSVLVVSAIGVAITASLLLLGLASSRTSFTVGQADQSKGLTNACTEEALEKIRESSSFTGSATITLGQGTCGYTVTNTGGTNRTIVASSTVGILVRKTTILINQIDPTINIVSWLEVSD
ncbi:MAG: hypothetical protein WCK37_01870 [Candidatus Falkowbacteria bacterium]